jgi:hypothetical protein
MADLVTVAGGSSHGIKTLSAAEHHAAVSALSKLGSAGGVSQGVASVFGGSLRSATLSGGTVHSDGIKVGATSLVAGRGADTFAGGVHSGATPAFGAVGSDTVVSGSAFSSGAAAAKAAATGGHAGSSGDTINVAGTTAASVKSEAAQAGKAVGHTITMADKTTITLTGVSTHDVVKPH